MSIMGGSFNEALKVPIEVYARYMDFADIEQKVNVEKAKAEANAQPRQQ